MLLRVLLMTYKHLGLRGWLGLGQGRQAGKKVAGAFSGSDCRVHEIPLGTREEGAMGTAVVGVTQAAGGNRNKSPGEWSGQCRGQSAGDVGMPHYNKPWEATRRKPYGGHLHRSS